MEPARGGPDVLGDGGREGDDVVLRDLLDLLDAGDVERRLRAQLARRVRRNDARLGHRVGRRELHLQPRLVAALVAPDRAHLRIRVPRGIMSIPESSLRAA